MAGSLIANLRESLPKEYGTYALQSGLKPSAILLPIILKQDEYHIVFNKRTDLVEYHKGEICFPGGARDPGDSGPVDTALRETEEEMGIDSQNVEILGNLNPEPTRSHFLINPIVGHIKYPYTTRVNSYEIAEVFEASISSLLDPQNVLDQIDNDEGELMSAYAFRHGDRLVWGATARILTQFLELVAGFLGKEVPWLNEGLGSKR
ncbi:CoA pyrophosphatase [SAR202 cluster bacterium AD-802-E10_MRT_200m]|nr:CoA pyrophosphatase [SAR202 cluster bacterium AD-802-E10_MRT_200m]